KYQMLQRVEFVKELLADKSLSLNDIAFTAGYSSAAHLSRRFKEATGMTPGQYVSSGVSTRQSIDKI
ncbi:MAG: AraC family transcriptional regulator, partial [Duncaniella sp.]|nr:AraC family transcriptional regulator [Duncaniella sp.]